MKNFLQKVSAYILGNTVQKLAVFLLIPLYTRWLTVDEFGALGSILSAILVITLISDMGLSSALIRFYHQFYNFKNKTSSYLKSFFILRLLSVICICLLILMLGSYLWGILTKDIIPPFPAIYYLAGIIFSDVILLSITAYYQAKHNAKIYISIKLFQSLGQLGLITYFIVVTNLGLEGVLLGHMLGSGIAFLVGGTLIIFNEIDLGAKFDGKFINQSLSYGLPLIPHSISIWIRNASDRIILTLFVPLAMVGIYHFGFTIGLGLGVLVNSLDIAYAPYFYRLMEDKIKEAEEIIINYSKTYILFLSTTSMLILVNLNDIIIIVGGTKYEEAQVIAPIIVASFFIHGLYTIFVKPIFHFKKTRILPYLTSVPAAIGVLANIYLIPIYDYRVAAYINLAVFLFTALSVLIYTQKIFFIRFPKSFLLITIEVLIVAFYTTSSLYQGVSNFEFIYESFLMLGLGYINYKVILKMNLNKVIKSLSQFQ